MRCICNVFIHLPSFHHLLSSPSSALPVGFVVTCRRPRADRKGAGAGANPEMQGFRIPHGHHMLRCLAFPCVTNSASADRWEELKWAGRSDDAPFGFSCCDAEFGLIATASSTVSFHGVIGSCSCPNLSGFVDQAVCVYCLVLLRGPTLSAISSFPTFHLVQTSIYFLLPLLIFISASLPFHEHF